LYTPKQKGADIKPCFVAHTDTVADKKPTYNSLVVDGVNIYNNDGVLGADDRAGIWIAIELMKDNADAYFLFTDEEEIGGLGAKEFVKSRVYSELVSGTSCFIELDRRGYKDIATYGHGNKELIDLFEQQGYEETYGSYTDIVELCEASIIGGINLSVGYYNEHTSREYLNTGEMKYTLNRVKDVLESGELHSKVFIADEEPYYKYTEVDVLDNRVLCDGCGAHAPLYDSTWGFVCEDCLEYYGTAPEYSYKYAV
jgi:hypothetical protein